MIKSFMRMGLVPEILFFLIFFMNLNAQTNNDNQTNLTQFVNPFVGTDGHGHTFPGASLPFGMIQLSPDTDTEGWDWCSGYHYSDNSIMGFSHTHLSGTGIGDYGDILFMPTTGELKTEPGPKEYPDSGYRSGFSHGNETAKPGYYSVLLDDYNIKAELTVTKRSGFHKYTFPGADTVNIIIDLVHGIQDKTTDSEIKITGNRIIEGFRRSTGWAKDHCVYFYAEFSKPFKSFGVVENGKIKRGKSEAKGDSLKAFIEYSTSANEAVLIKVGISHSSPEGARANLKKEIPGWNFDEIRSRAEQEWEKSLSSIEVETKHNSYKNIFYTSLYHSLLVPNTLSDADGTYTGMDGKVHRKEKGEQYTVFSLWDTFRAEHPLLTIIDKERALDMVNALISKYNEHGLLPVWELASNETGTMIGYHSVPVIVDAYFKGIRDFDIEKAFEAMKKSAMQNHLGLEYYKEMGYIPSDLENESVSKSLEYAYDDWCIAQLAKDLMKEDDYKYFIERAKFYTNLFDASVSLMRPRNNGKWLEPFDPYAVTKDYTEANAWQYSFFVPHDINGLIKLMKGEKNFISKLDDLFTTESKLTGRFQSDITGMVGQYAQGNEPSHHMAYLYNYAGTPWKTQETVHKILTSLYTDKPDGLPGNEDCGQMSAWYIFSSMGFYPVCPGDEKYIIGAPLFDKITIHTGDTVFTIIANNLSRNSIYIQDAELNGSEYPLSFISHSDISKGGVLIFEMGPRPSEWGTGLNFRPKSSVDIPFVPLPVIASGERVFRDSQQIALSPAGDSSIIYFSVDGSDPLLSKIRYNDPFMITETTTLKAVSKGKNNNYSKLLTARFNKIPAGRYIKINTPFSQVYSAGGDIGLIDNIKGTSNFHTSWQGYEGVDFDAVVDIGKSRKIFSISTSFLKNIRSWIFFPVLIEYYVSADGENFTKVYEVENTVEEVEENDIQEEIKTFHKTLNGVEARYIKVLAKNIGYCPPWHIGAGGKAWIFIDEISVE